MQPIDISVAVWVGFLALFGIATDNGVLVWTYLENLFRERRLTTVQMVRAAVVEAGRPTCASGYDDYWPFLKQNFFRSNQDTEQLTV